MKKIIIAGIDFYRIFISGPVEAYFGGGCKHEETCSEFARREINTNGALKGGVASMKRLLTCW